MDGTEKVHNEGGIRTSHTEIDNGHSSAIGYTHIGIVVRALHLPVVTEDVHIVIEIGNQHIGTEFLKFLVGIALQPIGCNLQLIHILQSINIII